MRLRALLPLPSLFLFQTDGGTLLLKSGVDSYHHYNIIFGGGSTSIHISKMNPTSNYNKPFFISRGKYSILGTVVADIFL